MVETLKQPQYSPMAVEDQVVSIFAAVKGFLMDIPVEKVVDFQKGLISYMQTEHPEIGESILQKKKLDDALEGEIARAIDSYKNTVPYRIQETKDKKKKAEA